MENAGKQVSSLPSREDLPWQTLQQSLQQSLGKTQLRIREFHILGLEGL